MSCGRAPPVSETLILVGGLEHFSFFHILGINHPNWLIFFRGVETTNQHCYVWLTWEMYQSYHHWFQSHHWNGLVILEQLLFPDLPPETSLSLSLSVYHHHLDPFEQFWSQSFSLIFPNFLQPLKPGIRRLQSSSHDTQLQDTTDMRPGMPCWSSKVGYAWPSTAADCQHTGSGCFISCAWPKRTLYDFVTRRILSLR